MKKAGALAVAGGVSLLALAVVLPSQSAAQRGGGGSIAFSDKSIGGFTPAVRDPRLAAELARRSAGAGDSALRFTPAETEAERNRAVRVAVRVRQNPEPPQRARPAAPGATAAVETPSGTAITPSTYNLGVAVGWRRFAVTGDVSNSKGGAAPGGRETAILGVDYRATPRLTGRVQIGAERAEGVQRIVGEDEAVALDVAGSYSIARNIDVTGGVRYRVSRDRIEPLANDARQDSQAVYIGTAVRF